MSVVVRGLIQPKYIESVQTTQYVAQNCRSIIDKLTVTNIATSNVSFSCNIVPVSGSAGNNNLIVKSRTLAPNETYTCPELIGHILEIGSFISMVAGSVDSLVVASSGREIT